MFAQTMISIMLKKLDDLEGSLKAEMLYLPNLHCHLNVLGLLKKFVTCGLLNGDRKESM
jgi:hypothetical protein